VIAAEIGDSAEPVDRVVGGDAAAVHAETVVPEVADLPA
jgi:hypothetical protein